MALTRRFRETVMARAKEDPDFRIALVGEALQAIVDGDLPEARILLRDCIHATMGFERLSELTRLPEKSLMRMVGASGNPTSEHLLLLLKALRKEIGVTVEVAAKAAA